MSLEEQIREVAGLLGGSTLPGASFDEIAATEYRLGVRLPDDVRALVSAFNGSELGTPVDHGWVTFWPLQAWQKVTEEPSAAAQSTMRDAILFADHSIVSWWYAIAPDPASDKCPVYLVDGVQAERLVAPSISGFLKAIIDDEDVLYRSVQRG